METRTTDGKCSHPTEVISYICVTRGCDDPYMCDNCLKNHNPYHFGDVQNLSEVLAFDPKGKLKEVQKLLADSISSRQKIDKRFETTLERIKEEILRIVDKSKKVISERGLLKEVKSVNALNGLAKELLGAKKDYSEVGSLRSDTGMIALNNYLEKYREFYLKLRDSSESLSSTLASNVSYRELDQQIYLITNTVEGTLKMIENAFYGDNSSPVTEEQKNQEDSLKNLKMISNINITHLTKEADLQLKAGAGWNSIEYINSFNTIVIGNDEGILELWDASTLKHLAAQKVHDGHVNSIRYYKKGNFFCSASNDGTVKILKIEELPVITILKTLTAHTNKVWCLNIVESQDLLFSSGEEPMIFVWDLKTLTVKHSINTGDRLQSGTEMAYIPRLKLLAVSFKQGCICLYNIETNEEMFYTDFKPKWLHTMVYLENRDELIIGSEIRNLKVWKISDQGLTLRKTYKIAGSLPTSARAINGGNELLVSAGHERMMSLNLDTGDFDISEDLGLNKIKTFKLIPNIRKIVVYLEGRDAAVLKY